jgi:hypothetical protein
MVLKSFTLNLEIDRFLYSGLRQLQTSAGSSRNQLYGYNLDKEVVKKIRVFDTLLESRDISTPEFMRLYPILALFTELVEVNYIVKRSRLWKGIEWTEECVDGQMRINEEE